MNPPPASDPSDAIPASSAHSPESGLKKVLANLAHLLGGKAMAGLMSLVYLPIVAHQLGVQRYGILILVNGYAVTVGSLIAFSGFHGVVRYGAIALEGGRPAELAKILRFMAVVELALGCCALLVAAIAVPLVGPRLGWSADAMRLALPYTLAVFSTVRATPQGLLQIAGRYDLVGLHQTVQPAVRLAGSLLVWVAGWGLEGFLVVWLVSCLADGGAMWLLALPSWRRLARGERLRGPWRGLTRDIEGFGRFSLITNFDITLRELAPNLAPLTIGWMLGPAAAGLFSLAQRATNLLQQPAVLLGQASYSVLAEQVARGRLDLLRRTVWRSAALATGIGAIIVAILSGAGDGLMRLLGGKSFGGASVLIMLLAMARAAGLVASPIAAGLTALGRPQRAMAVTLTSNLGLYPLLPLLIWQFARDGAGWHALLQNVIATGLLALFFARDARA